MTTIKESQIQFSKKKKELCKYVIVGARTEVSKDMAASHIAMLEKICIRILVYVKDRLDHADLILWNNIRILIHPRYLCRYVY
jgi:hypothetical protein